MKRIVLIIIASLLSLSTYAQNKVDTDFTQTKVMKVSGKTINKIGHIVFDGNDQLRITYTNPDGDYFIIEGNKVKINMDGKKTDLDTDKVKTAKLQSSTLLNCLSDNWEQAAKDNNADLAIIEEGGAKTVSIVAKGKVPRGGYNYVKLTYRLSDGLMTEMVLEEAAGIINTYKIR